MLVWCGLEREPRRKLRHARVVRRARRAAQLLPLGVHLDQVRRHRPHLLRRALLALLPRLARAQTIEPHRAVLTHLLEPLEELEVISRIARRNLEGSILEAHLERLLVHARAVGQRLELRRPEYTLEVADAVLAVHDVVAAANLRFRQLG